MPSILSIGVTGLNASKRGLTTTGHNITNVNTPGYSRQRVIDATREAERSGNGWLGNGVRTQSVERLYNGFAVAQVRSTQSSASELSTYATHAGALDDIYGDPAIGLGPVVQDFFDATQGLADDPSSVAARQLMLSNAQTLVDRFHYLDRRNADLRGQADRDMASAVDRINGLAGNIAEVNAAIIDARAGSNQQPPNDLLDQRDQMLDELSQLVDLSAYEQDDGALNVFIGNGQTLVIGNRARALETRANPLDPTKTDVVYSDGGGGQIITGALHGGELGGLLRFRHELLDKAGNQLGLIAMGIADRVNQQHRLGLDLNGLSGGDFFAPPTIETAPARDNNGVMNVSATLADVSNVVASDYELRYDGGTSYTLTRLSDQVATSIDTGGASPYTSAPIDGFQLLINSGAAVGDRVLIQPTSPNAAGIERLVDDPRRIAAAAPLRAAEASDANGNPVNSGDARISQPEISRAGGLPLGSAITLTFDPNAGGPGVPGFDLGGGVVGSVLYNPAVDGDGKSFTFSGIGGMRFEISGTPAPGDAFVIGNTPAGSGDNRNALRLAGLQGGQTLLGGSASFQDAYSRLVSDIGAKTRHAKVNAESQQGLLRQAQSQREAISGVNLDEEAANLLKYQQAYQASAQVISTAQTLFDTLLSATRR